MAFPFFWGATIQPSTPDRHQMSVPIDYGMWVLTCDQNGNRKAVKGPINPFWIAVKMLLRAMGLYGEPSTNSNPAGGPKPMDVVPKPAAGVVLPDSARASLAAVPSAGLRLAITAVRTTFTGSDLSNRRSWSAAVGHRGRPCE